MKLHEDEYRCPCGETFTGTGAVHGQPAALWKLLEHQAAGHGSES